MTFTATRACATIWIFHNGSRASRVAMLPTAPLFLVRQFHKTRPTTEEQKRPSSDPRINDIGRAIEDDFATIRDNYGPLSPLKFPPLAHIDIVQPHPNILLSLRMA